MATGYMATITEAMEKRELPPGFVVTASGRISGAAEPAQATRRYPLKTMDLVALDDALTYGTRDCTARLAVYVGDLGEHSAARARQILAKVPTPNEAVLVAVDPNRHAIEVVYGEGLRGRGAQTAAPRAVAAAAAAYRSGKDLTRGLVDAVRVLATEIYPVEPPRKSIP
ncbi:DUF5130 family protein [Mycobacterium celatum]|uniref:DUF5130 domain-containing protein n=1 Tax=Mycobacterium celatum TaxID=28045 RepID=A0A1X1RUD6_MYCCE|nr:DUF5130 family protein [Mycobacterium celatum]ORV18056.1 hypothetical protein AWB95_04360 [Mycobacterium celatum]